MTDYSSAITALIIVTVVISAAVVYVLAQPTDLPRYKENDPRSKGGRPLTVDHVGRSKGLTASSIGWAD